MQVDNVDCYRSSHIVMTGEKRVNNITLIFFCSKGMITIQKEKKAPAHLLIDDTLYITMPCQIKFSVIKHDYKEKKAFDTAYCI